MSTSQNRRLLTTSALSTETGIPMLYLLGRSVVTYRQTHAQFAYSSHSQNNGPWLCWRCRLASLMWHRAQEASKTYREQSQSCDMLAQFCNLKMRSWLASRQLSSTSTSIGWAPNTGPSVQPVLSTIVQVFVKGNKERCRASAKHGQKCEICSSKPLSLWPPLDT